MNVWLVLRNIGAIISFLKTFSGLVEVVAKEKAAPPKDQIKKFLDAAEDLLDSGVIDIPGVDESSISEALKQIEEQLCQSKPAA